MTYRERIAIYTECSLMSDEKLIDYYHKKCLLSLGSQVEDMYNLGYDMVDIEERISYEKYLIEELDIIVGLLKKRNLDPWK